MDALVRPDGTIRYGLYDEPIQTVNPSDYILESPMGSRIDGLLKKMRFNQFHFVGVISPDIMAGAAVVDLKLIGNGFFYVYDRHDSRMTESKRLAPPNAASIAMTPASPDSRFSFAGLSIAITDRRISVKGKSVSLDAELDRSAAKPLRICTRAGYRGWVYTEKTTPVPLEGTVTCNGKTWPLKSPDAYALIDWTAGFMRRNTFWNWAAIAAKLPDGRSLGLNLAAGVNETGFTENAFWIDNRMIKIDTVHFEFNAGDLFKPWQITSFDGKIDLTFTPQDKREEKKNAMILASRFTQFVGTFSGTLTTDSGEQISVSSLPGYAEDHYAKW
jgi:hypothetical protein